MRRIHHPVLIALPLVWSAALGAAEIDAGGTGAPEPATTTAGGALAGDSKAWEPAHWEDRGATHVWVDGHYVPRPAVPPPNVVWESGHWTWSQDGWVWNAGHYVSTTPVSPPAATESAPSDMVVDQAPPPVQVDVVTTCPGPDYSWCDGYWDFRFNAWVWIPGAWCPRPFAGAVWSGPRWDHVDRFDHDHGDRDHGFGSRGGFAAHGGFRLSPGHWRGR